MAAAVVVAALILGAEVSWAAAAGAEGSPKELPPFTQYQIRVTLDDTHHTLAGTEVITYTNRTNEALNELYFLLTGNADREPNPYIYGLWTQTGYPNGFDPGWTKVKRVTLLAGTHSPVAAQAVVQAGVQPEVQASKSDDTTSVSFTLEPTERSFQRYSLADGMLRVPLPRPLAPGKSVRVLIDFESKFPERRLEPAVFNGLYDWRFGWFPVERARDEGRWHDGMKFVPGLFDVELTVPADFVVASGADVQEEVVKSPNAADGPNADGPNADGEGVATSSGATTAVATKTYRLIGESAGRLSMPLVMGRKFEVLAGKSGEIPIIVYYQYGAGQMANKLLSMAQDILADYSKRFGPYLYGRLVITENSTLGAGMAVDGLVTLTESVWRNWNPANDASTNRTLEWFLAHEIGHQWWGIGVRADMLDENWLSEAFAEYLAHSYMDQKYEAGGAKLVDPESRNPDAVLLRLLTGNPTLREMMEERPYLDAVRSGIDEAPVKKAEDYRYMNSYSTTVYNKGYLILRGAEGIVGREKMDEALRAFFERHGGGDPVDVATFVREVSAKTGVDLDPYFAQWLRQDGAVDFAVDGFTTREGEGGKWLTTVRVRNNGSFRMPATVEVTTADGSTARVVWDGGEKALPARMEKASGTPAKPATGEVVIETNARAVRAAIDPDRYTLDVDRLNNFSPRKIKWAPYDANPIDAYVVRFVPGIMPVEQPDSFLPELRPWIGVGAKRRDDWSWDVYASLERGGAWTKYNLQLVKGVEGTVRLSNAATGFGRVRVDGYNRLFAEAGTGFRVWTPVDVGTPGGYLERGLIGEVAGGRDVGADGAPRYYGRARVLRDLTTQFGWGGVTGAKAATDGSVVVDGLGTGYVGLGKNLIAALSVAGGQVVAGDALADDRPGDTFRGYGDKAAGVGGAAFASVDVNYPLARNLNIGTPNTLVLDGVEARVFGEVGSSWDAKPAQLSWDVVRNGIKADAGAEVVLGLSLSESIPLGLRVGYAHRVIGGDPGQLGRFYFGLGLWFDRMLMGN